MNYKYLMITIGISIMTNSAYNGFNFAKLAEHAVGYSDYITHMWTSSNLEGKITLTGAVGVVSWCSYLLCHRMTLAPAKISKEQKVPVQQLAPEQIDLLQQQIAILKDDRDRLLRIGGKLVNIQELNRHSSCASKSRICADD